MASERPHLVAPVALLSYCPARTWKGVSPTPPLFRPLRAPAPPPPWTSGVRLPTFGASEPPERPESVRSRKKVGGQEAAKELYFSEADFRRPAQAPLDAVENPSPGH